MTVPMRSLTFGELLDGSFTLLRRHFSTFFLTALAPQLPLLLLWLALPMFAGGGADVDAVLGGVTVMIMPYSLLATAFLFGALTHAAAVAYAGEEPTVGAALGRGLRKLLPIAVASVLMFAGLMLGFILLVIPGVIFFTMWFAVYPAIVVEDRGPVAAFGRSQALSRGARMRILGVMLVAWLITTLPLFGVMMVAGVGAGAGAAIAGMAADGGGLWFTSIIQAVSLLVSGVTWPFLMLVTVLLYYDRRARTEAPDLESAAAALHGLH